MKQIQAVQCKQCRALLDEKEGNYIIIETGNITTHRPESVPENQKENQQRVTVNNEVVCNNQCLSNLFALRGF